MSEPTTPDEGCGDPTEPDEPNTDVADVLVTSARVVAALRSDLAAAGAAVSGPSAEERAESVGGFSRKDVANRLLVAVSIDFNEPRDYLRRLLTAAAIMLDRDAAADAAGYARGAADMRERSAVVAADYWSDAGAAAIRELPLVKP